MSFRALATVVALLVFGTAVPSQAASADFSNWLAVVVSGDYRGHQGERIAAFDNARRDIRKTIEGLGFSPDYIAEFASGPDSDEAHPEATRAAIDKKLVELGTRAMAGCLLYFTSHGSPAGMVLGKEVMTPLVLWKLVTFNCDKRPAIVIVSACFSGIFVTPEIATANRLVLTAASNHTSSFGCNADNKYPWFDRCFLESASLVHDFVALAERTRGCVSALEVQSRLDASLPQLALGAEIAPLLRQLRFSTVKAEAPPPEPTNAVRW